MDKQKIHKKLVPIYALLLFVVLVLFFQNCADTRLRGFDNFTPTTTFLPPPPPPPPPEPSPQDPPPPAASPSPSSCPSGACLGTVGPGLKDLGACSFRAGSFCLNDIMLRMWWVGVPGTTQGAFVGSGSLNENNSVAAVVPFYGLGLYFEGFTPGLKATHVFYDSGNVVTPGQGCETCDHHGAHSIYRLSNESEPMYLYTSIAYSNFHFTPTVYKHNPGSAPQVVTRLNPCPVDGNNAYLCAEEQKNYFAAAMSGDLVVFSVRNGTRQANPLDKWNEIWRVSAAGFVGPLKTLSKAPVPCVTACSGTAATREEVIHPISAFKNLIIAGKFEDDRWKVGTYTLTQDGVTLKQELYSLPTRHGGNTAIEIALDPTSNETVKDADETQLAIRGGSYKANGTPFSTIRWYKYESSTQTFTPKTAIINVPEAAQTNMTNLGIWKDKLIENIQGASYFRIWKLGSLHKTIQIPPFGVLEARTGYSEEPCLPDITHPADICKPWAGGNIYPPNIRAFAVGPQGQMSISFGGGAFRAMILRYQIADD